MSKENEEQRNEHIIQVPLYTIPLKDEDNEVLFPTNYEDIIIFLESRLKSFEPKELINNKKEKKTLIENISFKRHLIGNIPCILVRCSVSDTNLGDTTLVDGTTIQLSTKAKITSNNYYFLLYPKIDGIPSKRICSILMMVYDDPYHDSSNSCRISTTIIKKVLQLKPRNIKLDNIINDIQQTLKIPDLKITLYSMDNTDSSFAPQISMYQTKSSKFEKRTYEYKSVPNNLAADLLSDDDCKDCSIKDIVLTLGKKQYRVKRDITKGIQNMKLFVESIFNSTIIIYDEDMPKLYEESFIIEKLQPVLSNFLSNGTINNI